MERFGDYIKQLSEQREAAWLTIYRATTEEEVYTLGHLQDRINDYTSFYRSQGIQPGDTVLIILRESLDLFASFFAGIQLGALPAYYAYPSPKQSAEQFLQSVDDLLRFNEVKLLVSYEEVINILQQDKKFDVSANFLGCVDHQSVDKAEEVISLEGNFEEAFLQFSSGTTGAKKGVRISARALFNQVKAYRSSIQFDGSSKIISWLPHYHDMGLIACMLIPFLEKVPVVMMSPFEWVKRPAMLLEAIEKHQGTHVWLPNFALGHLTNAVKADTSLDLSSLERIVCCSEPVLYETTQRFLKHFENHGLKKNVLRNCYAMAENTFAMTTSMESLDFLEIDYKALKEHNRVELLAGGYRISSAGKPLDNIQVRIADAEGTALPELQVGEIHILSDCMLDGYHQNPEATQAAFVGDWFNTGDLGFLHQGELYITGRKKELIVVGGENIYPQDVEAILNDTTGFLPGRNVVFGVEDPRVGTEKMVALAEVDSGVRDQVDVVAIRAEVFNRLNITLTDLILLEPRTLKKSTAGKISRFLNQQEYLAGNLGNNSTSEQSDRLIGLILEAIPTTQKPVIQEDTALFASGLIDSFGFANLVSTLEAEFNIQVEGAMLDPIHFQTPAKIRSTIAALQSGGQVDQADVMAKRQASFERLSKATPTKGHQTFRELLLNKFPFPRTILYIWFLRLMGIQIGKKVMISGRIHFKIRGKASNIRIGDYVRLSRNVDLRNRENGTIILHRKVYLDDNTRIVAAREGTVEMLEGAELSSGCIINSGGNTTIGRYTMIAGNVNINSSSHGTQKSGYIREIPHLHGNIRIEDDVWIGSGASILMNTTIREGAIISSNSLVSGEIPAFALCAGVPAKVIRYRSNE